MTEPRDARRAAAPRPRTSRASAASAAGAAERFLAAIRAGDDAAVERALKRNPRLLEARDRQGLSGLMVAAYNGHPHLAERLAARAMAGSTAERPALDLFEAASVGDVATLRSLLAAGAQATDRSADGFTALHLAAFFGRLAAARLLLDRGAEPDAVADNEMQVRPLHSALAGRHRDVASLLLAHGAAVNARQQGGYTPLHEAAQSGDEATAELLLLRGADPTAVSDERQTPIDLAEASGNAALAKVLREAAGQSKGFLEPPARHETARHGPPATAEIADRVPAADGAADMDAPAVVDLPAAADLPPEAPGEVPPDART